MSKLVRPKYGLDVDGVYADFTYGFTSLAHSMGIVPAPWHCGDQDVWNFNTHDDKVPPGMAVRFDDRPVWAALDSKYNWWMTLEPLVSPEEVDITNDLINEADVYFITSRGATAGLSTEAQTAGWLRGIGVNVDRATVIACSTSQKGPIAAALKIGAFIDDHMDNLYALDAHGVPLVVARAQRYNEAWAGSRADCVGAFIESIL